MNSAIISFVYSLAQSFWGLFKKSGTYKLFESIYKSFSNAWKHSIIVNLFKKDEDTDEVAKSSLLYKVFNSVFVFLTFLRNKLGNWLKAKYPCTQLTFYRHYVACVGSGVSGCEVCDVFAV